MKTIAITGATGQFSTLALDFLKKQDVNVIALARSPEKISGVQARAFDYTKTDGQVEALQGVDTLILVSSNDIPNRIPQHLNVIHSAKQTGVKRIVYTSLAGNVRSLLPDHLETEKALKASGIPYTILRNGWYAENYTASIPTALALGVFYGSAKNGKISSALRSEFAEVAVKVAVESTFENKHENQTYELAGSTSYTLSDLAEETSKQTGKDIPYVDISKADYAAALVKAGLPEDFANLIAEWDEDASTGALYSEDKTLEKLLGRPTASLADVVKLALQS